ncbi:lipopolysaccharide core heptose(I) kinase RfaP [Shimwellia blattae]|uniref:Lipopolysaccharide core heptose(I) kinase n=1 Tax=Shimwellia blattae (strain ATCC 29907 / DSM 4481 / JCM 1650 / NBRC 105725 / CDC 9005-74) TaxID=630626 RepID=I2BEH7_SHIBC|nr:lipopolysaccharide core heptose(I) kinase RfaP [Shimwellia blattae]AFJ48931.1 lipopolysaccharide core biosynthesis protein [Shimwellia blattae DSM 4481 = NBRC 105725]GAB81797.1 lipopolysaccharide core heptose(I) kinase [Shimwellia blattae DSM 4481 = NBRC 105725]VDY66416.1 Lipopolysaccharide core heptose(I) kinase rfaP [Shimwellia blattae]VEC28163.1 Lipopolysaccharide core heptose(I) kinase rfaP [Shimwellia blattae]
MVELKEPLATLWRGKDAFAEVQKLRGEVFRELETRRTLRFELAGNSYFLKWHHGTSVKEVVKNLLSLRLPVLGADREWNAIHKLHDVGVDTMHGVGFGQRGVNPLRRTSFIITEDLTPTISLEDYCADWATLPPDPRVKRMIIRRVATMVRKMHQAGVNHRDCYICHFLLHLPFEGDEQQLKISVIDLHRAQMRSHVPRRWRDKDLIGLYFSSLNIGLTQRDIFRFMKVYFARPLRDTLVKEQALLSRAQEKASKIQERTIRKAL